jgi:hypothetical protein
VGDGSPNATAHRVGFDPAGVFVAQYVVAVAILDKFVFQVSSILQSLLEVFHILCQL